MRTNVVLLSIIFTLCVVNICAQFDLPDGHTFNSTGMSAQDIAGAQQILGHVLSTCGNGQGTISGFPSTTDMTATTKDYLYVMNPCGIVNDPGCKNSNANMMICQKSTGTPISYYSLGSYQGGTGIKWSGTATSVVASLNNGDTCWTNAGQIPREVDITFTCAGTGSNQFQVVEPQQIPPCKFAVTATVACGTGGGNNPPPNGPTFDFSVHKDKKLSGGSIFLIVFFCIIPVYIIAGIIYNMQVKQIRGIESCPQWNFWKQCPGMIKDGFVFTFTKLRGLCTGGKGGSSDNYSDIDKL